MIILTVAVILRPEAQDRLAVVVILRLEAQDRLAAVILAAAPAAALAAVPAL